MGPQSSPHICWCNQGLLLVTSRMSPGYCFLMTLILGCKDNLYGHDCRGTNLAQVPSGHTALLGNC